MVILTGVKWCLAVFWFAFLCFPCGSDGKESACNVGDLGSIPGLGRSPGGGHGNPLQYSCLGNPRGQRNLAGYSPWGWKESDMTERLNTAHYYISSTSDHQALNPRGWGPLFYRTHLFNPQWSHHLRSLIWHCICKEPISKGHILGLGNGRDIGKYYQPLHHPIDVLWVLNYF